MKIKKTKNNEYFKVLVLRTVGNFLILTSLFMFIKTLYQPVREEIRFFIDRTTNKKYVLSDVNKEGKGAKQSLKEEKTMLVDLFKKNETQIIVPEDPAFSVVIPKIGANAKVIQNVDASNKNEYLDVLKKGVAHTQGTAFPGEKAHIFLFAHSTDYFWNLGNYNAVFYLLYKLERGDEINLVYKGNRYLYKVIGTQVVDPSQVEYIRRKSNKEFLTLQTCWPPGTTLKRLMVYATRVEE
ncbi:MAG: sortase [bacterium]